MGMFNALLRDLRDLTGHLEMEADALRSDLQGWSASSETVATKIDKIADRIEVIAPPGAWKTRRGPVSVSKA